MSDSTPDETPARYTPEELRKIRKRELGLTIEALAVVLGYDPSTIHRYENGKTPSTEDFIRDLERLWDEELERRYREEPRLVRRRAPDTGRPMLRLRPERSVGGAVPELYWVPPPSKTNEGAAPPNAPPAVSAPGAPQVQGGTETPSMTGAPPRGPVTPRVQEVSRSVGGPDASSPQPVYGRQVMRLQFAIAAVAILISIRSGKRRRAGDATTGRRGRFTPWAVAGCVGLLLVSAGCFHALRGTPSAEVESVSVRRAQEPASSRELSHAEEGMQETGKETGTSPDHSVPMPKKPFPWQKRAPCDPQKKELEDIGACWLRVEGVRPPCPGLFEIAGECVQPVVGTPKGRYSEKP